MLKSDITLFISHGSQAFKVTAARIERLGVLKINAKSKHVVISNLEEI